MGSVSSSQLNKIHQDRFFEEINSTEWVTRSHDAPKYQNMQQILYGRIILFAHIKEGHIKHRGETSINRSVFHKPCASKRPMCPNIPKVISNMPSLLWIQSTKKFLIELQNFHFSKNSNILEKSEQILGTPTYCMICYSKYRIKKFWKRNSKN